MPPTTEDRLRDILEAIVEIRGMLAGVNRDQFAADRMRRMATERYLELICEAARRLPKEVKLGGPGIEWRKLNDFGNVLRHANSSTSVDVVWDIIQNHLPPLRSFVEVRIGAVGK
jgi:uncharacterized protein with HEPN domain